MSNDDRKEFARRLVATRIAFCAITGQPRMSRAQFAAIIGIDAERYRRYERGEVEPQVSVLRSLRELTGISLDYLLCGAGSGIEDLSYFESECEVSFGQRLRWTRELFEPDIEAVATLMKVTVETWRRWERDREPMPLDKVEEAAHRFSVSMNFLVRGLPHGIAWPVLKALLQTHPTLWRKAPHTGKAKALDSNSPATSGFSKDRPTKRRRPGL